MGQIFKQSLSCKLPLWFTQRTMGEFLKKQMTNAKTETTAG